jgi:hypothetical protein
VWEWEDYLWLETVQYKIDADERPSLTNRIWKAGVRVRV